MITYVEVVLFVDDDESDYNKFENNYTTYIHGL